MFFILSNPFKELVHGQLGCLNPYSDTNKS